MLISQCVEDISRFAAGDMDLQHTTDTLINDMDRTETLGIRSFIVNNSRAIRRMNYFNKKEEIIIFQIKDSRNIKSSCQIPIKRNSVSRDIIM